MTMAYWLYSAESFPNQAMLGKPGYTPEYLAHAGVQLAPVEKEKWTSLPTNWIIVKHRDWMDRRGTPERVLTEDIAKAIANKQAGRGLVILDHEPTPDERKRLEKECADANMAFRMKAVEWYENQVREKEVTGHGRTNPTPYEDECYTILGLTKPYSVEAMRAQRHPGEAVGEQIVAALDRLDKRRQKEEVTRAEADTGTGPAPRSGSGLRPRE
jgi:hypothetical protein